MASMPSNLTRPTGMMGTGPATLPLRKPVSAIAPQQPGMPAPTAPSGDTNLNRGVVATPPLPPGDPATPVRTMNTGGPLPPDRVPMQTGGPLPPTRLPPPLPPGDPATRMPMQTGGPLPPERATGLPNAMQHANPHAANGLYRAAQQMQQRFPTPAVSNAPTPDKGRAASDGTTPGVAQPVGLPPGMTYQQRPVSATGVPSQPPGPVGRPAGGLFHALSRK